MALNWLLDRLRAKRFSVQTQNPNIRRLYFGTIVKMSYSNYKHDPNPLIWVQYSNQKYTHGINLNYLYFNDKRWFAKMIYLMKKGNQIMDGRTMYKFFKLNRYAVVEKAYRLYFTNMIHNPRMVSAGITNLDKLIYPYKDPYIDALNKAISTAAIGTTAVQIAYSQDELRNRIIGANNIRNVHSIKVGQQGTGGIQRAPWIKTTS